MFLKQEWEFNDLQICNYKIPGKLKGYFDFITQNHNHLEGDICEVGVYRGFSILATGLLLKDLGSDKKVYGFDSFAGFPSYHENDSLTKFEDLYASKAISEEHFEDYKLNILHKKFISGKQINPSTISSSLDFSETSLELLKSKIDYLGLDNIVLVDGDYKDTMRDKSLAGVNFMSALIDCDLYESHKFSLPFVWDRMVLNGYIYLDEYYSLKFPGARIATNEFFLDKKDKPQMYPRNLMDFERWFVLKNNSN
jgi:hypothetical protein